MKTYEARIPFTGFYESIYDSEIDSCIDLIADGYAEKGEVDVDAEFVKNELYTCCNFGDAHREIARQYVDAFFNWFRDEFDIAVDAEYVEMTSPREYNFETDKIYVRIPESALIELRNKVDVDALNKAAVDLFKSRDGFISFYDYQVDQWSADVTDWDYNLLFCLLTAYCDSVPDYQWAIYYEMNEKVYGAVGNAVDWKELRRRVDEHIAEEKENVGAEMNVDRFKIYPKTSDKAISENLAAVDKDLVHVLRSTDNPAEYIHAFSTLNHLKG